MKAEKVTVTNYDENSMTQFFESEGTVISSIRTISVDVVGSPDKGNIHTGREPVTVEDGNIIYPDTKWHNRAGSYMKPGKVIAMDVEQRQFSVSRPSIKFC